MRFSTLMDTFTPNILQRLEARRKELVSEGMEVINLSVGTPDLPPAKHVMEAFQAAAGNPENYKYTLHDLPALADAVIGWYATRYQVAIERDELLAVYGSQEGIAHIAFTLCNPGDTVIVCTPGYPIFSFGPLLAGAKLYTVPLMPENNYLIDFDAIDTDTAKKARAIIVSYPNNPLAAVANDEFYIKLIEFAKRYDIVVIHDNAYSEFIHDGTPGGSFLQYPGAKDVGIEFNSLSKSHNLSGLRISFALGNRELIKAFASLRSQIDYGISFPDQLAAIAALTGSFDTVLQNRAAYRNRRDTLCLGLNEIGWRVSLSKATMFAWLPVPKGYTSESCCVALLEKAGVICVPGNTFGAGGEGWIRAALVSPVPVIERAIQNIADSGLLT